MFQESGRRIQNYMRGVLDNYNEIRGKPVGSGKYIFWDAVIISATDVFQEKGYKLQIKLKIERGELPLDVPFHVFADPPGYKIGCGGSTLFILNKIFKIYGNAMDSMRFLFIPAGGYSQRLPNLTVLGKLFSPLPFKNYGYQMLDLILAAYLPFLKRMPPGIFLASSDAIISYTISDEDSWSFVNDGFTALAHPSSLMIGTTHGVYVVPQQLELGNKSALMSDCLRVLQKPTVEEMHEKGAVFKISNTPGSDEHEELLFSDSAFFFTHTISKLFISIYKNHKPIKCELNSYGDFLQPLGLSASPTYIMNKVTSEELASMRSVLYRELFGAKLSLVILKDSNFHHLGTMPEYIDALCQKTSFSIDFPLTAISFSCFTVPQIKPSYVEGTAINSVLNPFSTVPKSTVVEYCDINVAIDIGNNCIVSNIQLPGFPVQKSPLYIPDNTLIHTIPLKNDYVTVAFNIYEDIKKSVQYKNRTKLKFYGKELSRFVKCDNMTHDSECSKVSLWETRLFPVCSTPEESFKQTLELVLCLVETDERCSTFSLDKDKVGLVSMKDLLGIKETDQMIIYQKNLLAKIAGNLTHSSIS